MKYTVQTVAHFDREIKRLCKKYASLTGELRELVRTLQENPETGVHLGNGIYKIRLAIASKQKGKSGGGAGDYLPENSGKDNLSAYRLR
jgi:mRNA-degrading endonuclease RelE of RelBE toxin-antitoxin system